MKQDHDAISRGSFLSKDKLSQLDKKYQESKAASIAGS